MTPRYTQALTFAARVHEGQRRKGTAIPYITHPVAVAALVAQYGGDEDQQIAALLHDVLEDGGPEHAGPIAEQFGARVLTLVEGCTDGTPDASGRKAPWAERKAAYLSHLGEATDELLLVSASDKLSNAQAIVADLHAIGVAVFDRFSAGQTGTLWYYGQLQAIFERRDSPIAPVFSATVAEMVRLGRATAD
jgi:(p)ppGpp synthase/HD superfamily hydrolase